MFANLDQVSRVLTTIALDLRRVIYTLNGLLN